jgi:hypothetical protein
MAITPDLLHNRGVFTFEEAALDELSQEFDKLQTSSAELRELICLTAAEFSLAKLFPYKQSVLPLRRPLPVRGGDALVGLLKANCGILCVEDEPLEPGPLGLARVTAFSGDVTKLALVGMTSPPGPTEAISAFVDAVEALERKYRSAPSRRARALADSGVLRLQAFLWSIKTAMAEVPLEDAVDGAYEAFELAQPSRAAELVPARQF